MAQFIISSSCNNVGWPGPMCCGCISAFGLARTTQKAAVAEARHLAEAADWVLRKKRDPLRGRHQPFSDDRCWNASAGFAVSESASHSSCCRVSVAPVSSSTGFAKRNLRVFEVRRTSL